MILPLRTTVYGAITFVLVVLGLLLSFGVRQYQLHRHNQSIIEQNEKIIFQFATIREHISESLLEGRYAQLKEITNEVETLNANISRVVQNPLIPDEYKLAFVNQVDLAGIILLLRSVGGGDVEPAKVRQLNQEVRILGDRLLLFDRIIVNYFKQKLFGFQTTVIGALAIAVFVVINVLLLLHRTVTIPLLDLVQQVKEVVSGRRANIASLKKDGAIAELTSSVHRLLAQQAQTNEGLVRQGRLLLAAQRVGVAISSSRSPEVLYKEACQQLLANDDYCFIWIGLLQGDSKGLTPVAFDGSTTMSRQECADCLAVLVERARISGSGGSGPLQVLHSAKPTVVRDVVADVPKGSLKNTPLVDGYANCAAFPLVMNDQVRGVLAIYSTRQDSFGAEEVDLLAEVAGELVAAAYALDRQAELEGRYSLLQAAHQMLMDSGYDIVLIVDREGTILEANHAACAATDRLQATLVGVNVCQFLSLRDDPGLAKSFIAALAGPAASTFEKGGGTRTGNYLVRVAPIPTVSGQTERVLVIAKDITAEAANKENTLMAARLAATGELAVGVAHEINNLSNGLINHAEIFSDELKELYGDKVRVEWLNKIIEEGDRIAHIVQQLLYFNRDQGLVVDNVQIDKVIAEALSLIKHQLKNDGIRVSTVLDESLPAFSANVQHLQHVFLNVVNNARHALNLRYPGQHEEKRLEIRGETAIRIGQQYLVVTITDWGVGIEPQILDRVFDPFFTTKPPGEGTGLGLSISRSLIADLHGAIRIESLFNDHTTVFIEVPVTRTRIH